MTVLTPKTLQRLLARIHAGACLKPLADQVGVSATTLRRRLAPLEPNLHAILKANHAAAKPPPPKPPPARKRGDGVWHGWGPGKQASGTWTDFPQPALTRTMADFSPAEVSVLKAKVTVYRQTHLGREGPRPFAPGEV